MSNYSDSVHFSTDLGQGSMPQQQQGQQQQQQQQQQHQNVTENNQVDPAFDLNTGKLESSFLPTFDSNNDKTTFGHLSHADSTQEDDVSIIEAVAAVAAAMNTDNKNNYYDDNTDNNMIIDTDEIDNELMKKHHHVDHQSDQLINANFQDDGLNFNQSNDNSIISETTDPIDTENDTLMGHSQTLNFNDLDKHLENDDLSKNKTIKFTPNKTSENIRKPHLYITNPTNKKAKREVNKGPPKNSRFFKVYNLDNSSKPTKSSSIHHYNPYRYPQNRSKLNPHPDFIKSKRVKKTKADKLGSMVSIDASKNLFYSMQPEINDTNNPPTFNGTSTSKIEKYDSSESEIPVFKPTLQEFEDIYSYIDSIKDIGKKYGAVKIIPPDEFTPKLSINLESFWIKSSRQSWRPPADELNTRCEFYNQLKEYLSINSKINLNKLPCIDKRAIDLYRLFCVVALRGGFQTCCNEKLWAQIGRELGFYGKISSSLSSSIKTVYQKYLSGWETEYREKNVHDFLNISRNDEKYSLFPQSDVDLSESSDKLNHGKKVIKKEPSLENASSVIDTPKAIDDKIPIILGSSASYTRNRQTMSDLGFPTYFDQSTTFKKGITVNTLQTLPGYDFYRWLGSDKVDDTPPTELKISSLYTLKQFNDKSRILKTKILNKFYPNDHFHFENLEYLENKYWELLENPSIIFETEVSFDQTTNIHDSSGENKFSPEFLLSPLNFNNSAITNDSMLQYVNSDSDTMFHSSLNFAMFFGTRSWTVEDQWLYNLDYHYLGDAKSVYVIPPEFQQKFEELIKSQYGNLTREQRRTEIAMKLFDNNISNSDIYSSSVENEVCFDLNVQRAEPHDVKFRELNKYKDESIVKFNNDMMFSPKYLKKHGIPVYHTYQEVGEMIIKFPKAYSSYFSVGTSVTESVNIAPLDWLNDSMEINKWFQKQQVVPKFSFFTMLVIAARESNDMKVLKHIEPILTDLVNVEIDKRNKIRGIVSEYECNSDYNVINELDKVKADYDNTNGLIDDYEYTSTQKHDDVRGDRESSVGGENGVVTEVKVEGEEVEDSEYELDEPVSETAETLGSELFASLSKWNKFTDSDLSDIFPGFVLAKNIKNKRSTFTLSLDYFIEKYEKVSFQSEDFEFSLINLVSDDYLKESLKILRNRFVNIETWSMKYHDVIERNGKPRIEELEGLFQLGKVLFSYENLKKIGLVDYNVRIIEEFKNFKAEFTRTEDWIKNVHNFFKIRQFNSVPLIEFEDLKRLINEIPTLLFKCDEVEKIFGVVEEIREFDTRARGVLLSYPNEKDINLEELKALYAVGCQLGVKLETFKKIDVLIKQKTWFANLDKKCGSLQELKQLCEEGKRLVEMIHDSGKAKIYEDNIETLKNKISKCESVQEELKELEKEERLTSAEELGKLREMCEDLPIADTLKSIESLWVLFKNVEMMVPELVELIEEKNKVVADDSVRYETHLETYLRVMKKVKDFHKEKDIDMGTFIKILKKCEKYHGYLELINKQVVETSFANIRDVTSDFNSVIRINEKGYYGEGEKFDEVKGIKYFVSYNLDILNSNEDRYCVCKQTHEGDMVECEMCQEWYHFGCVGYESGKADNGKFLCPLCDYEGKLETTVKFNEKIKKRVSFEAMKTFSRKIMLETCKLRASGLAFLAMVGEFDRFEASVVEFGLVERDQFGKLQSKCTNLKQLQQLLERLDGALFSYNEMGEVLHSQFCSLKRVNTTNE